MNIICIKNYIAYMGEFVSITLRTMQLSTND